MKFHEKPTRSLAKAITFRILIIVANSLIVFGLTQEPETTKNVMIITTVSSTALYFVHERAWNIIHWGKHKKSNG